MQTGRGTAGAFGLGLVLMSLTSCGGDNASPSQPPMKTTVTASCEYLEDFGATFHWCVEREVPPGTNLDCRRIDVWHDGQPVTYSGVEGSGCSSDAVWGHCAQGEGKINVYNSEVTPAEVQAVCDESIFMPADGHAPPEPTGCTMTISWWSPSANAITDTTVECQAYFIADNNNGHGLLEFFSSDQLVELGIFGWTSPPSGPYSCDSLPMDLGASGTALDVHLSTNDSDTDSGQFSITVGSITPQANSKRQKVHGTLDATFPTLTSLKPADHPVVVHAQAD